MPMPPLVVPNTNGNASDGSHPDCCHACCAAASNKREARSSLVTARNDSRVGGAPDGNATSAATFTLCRDTSNSVTGRNALRPERNPSALLLQSRPSAVTTPAPVTTIRGAAPLDFLTGNSTVIRMLNDSDSVENSLNSRPRNQTHAPPVETGP